jgi:putative membrane protein
MDIVFIAVVVVAVGLLVRWLGGRTQGGALHNPQGKTPLDILKERFAKGEIDKEEFEEQRRVPGEWGLRLQGTEHAGRHKVVKTEK